MCIFNQHNPMYQSTYRPIEAAIFWCNLHRHQDYILDAAWGTRGQLIQCFRCWPDLNRHFNNIVDAITHGELPSILSNFKVPLTIADNCMHMSIRHVELQRWMVRYYPDQRPSFLFDSGFSCLFSEELCSTLSRRVDSLNIRYQLDQEKIAQLTSSLAELTNQLALAQAKLNDNSAPSPQSLANHKRLVGALMELFLGISPGGKCYSVFDSQSAIITAISAHNPTIRGLSKRALEKHFTACRRSLHEES